MQSVIVARERHGKTITFVTKSEDAAVPTLEDRIEPGSTVFADEASHWDKMHARYDTRRINHSLAYSTAEGCTNQAESLFSRLRRAEIGTHHHIAGPYLAAYAAEMDWREDNRQVSNGEQYRAIVSAAAKAPCLPPVEGLLAAPGGLVVAHIVFVYRLTQIRNALF